ncbi:unnamed protein product [Laminaria digitata]
MRGIHKKGKNGPGLTGIQRVLNTRERVQEVEDPCKVMISNLDYSLTEEDVKVFCSTAGPVTAVKLIKKRYAKTSKGFGFVDFEQPLTATIALEELNGKEFHGRIVELKPAITTREKRIQETTEEWEQRSLEKERRSAEGYADEDEGEKGEGESRAKKAAVPSKDGSIQSTDEFFDFVGRRVKPKPQISGEDPE